MVRKDASMSNTCSVTMTNLKADNSDASSIWQGYSLQAPPSTSAPPPPFESNFPSNPLAAPYHHARPQKGSYRSLDIPSMHPRPPPREGGAAELTASPPSLNTHNSYPSQKRAFQCTEDSPYGEGVQDFSEELSDVPKPSINQDHRLLSFSGLAEKHTLIDNHGRVQKIEVAAQIHGMFFLSEMATPVGEGGLLVQPELTCYRRNLFQISGSATTPRAPLSLISERGERIHILSLGVVVSATESVDGHNVKLIVIPWKTPPPNSPEVGPGQEREPSPIPLLPLDEVSPEVNGEFAVYPIAYRRLQFRIATANNGRRRELQQHFTLHLNVVASLANGNKVNVRETSTAPIVVRGRSPRNFQARKEIPLVGSSSSRGQAPELHVTTSSAPGSASGAGKPKAIKAQTLELPRSAQFNFDASNLQGSPSMMRHSTYPTWNPSHPSGHSTAPPTPSYPAAPIGMENYLQVKPPVPESHSPTSSIPVRHPPNRQQFNYHPTTTSSPTGAPIRFIESNPRPAKSPRHAAPPDLPTNVSYPEFGGRFAAPYNGTNDPLQPREYFPTILPTHSWTTAPESGAVYGTTTQPPHVQQYDFPSEPFVKQESNPQSHYNWNPA